MEFKESVDVDLNRYLSTLKRRWKLAVGIFGITACLGILAITLIKPRYEAEGKLLFKLPSFDVVGSNLVPNKSEGEGIRDLRPLVATQNPISTQIEVISSYSLLQQAIEKLQLKDDKGEPLKAQDLEKKLSIKIIGGTDVLQILYESHNPEEAAAVINTVMNLYLENDISTNRSEAQAARQFLEKQLPQNQAAVQAADEALRKFKQQNNVVDLTEEAKSTVAITASLDTEITTVKAALDEINTQTNEMRYKVGLNSQDAITVSAMNQSPAVQGVLTQIQETERQLANERSRLSDNHPIIINLQQRKAYLQALLQQQTEQSIGNQTKVPQRLLQIGELKQNLIADFLQSEVQQQGLATRLASLYNSRSVYEQRIKVLPQLEQTQRELERKLDVAQSTYQTLLKKIQELRVAENETTASARIVANALVPDQPVLKKKNYRFSAECAVWGRFLSTTTVLVLEERDKSLKTLQEIKKVFGYTLLGTIPLIDKATSKISGIAVRDKPRSLISEMYQMIQTNLKSLNLGKVLKTIVVTSAVPKEGKSSVAANLAVVIAQLGRKVLLIDADMRVPSQHHLWLLNNTSGLNEVLDGQTRFHNSVCQVMNNLDVLTAGNKPSNPLALLDSERMASLIANFSDQYDFVIIDTPPVLLAADALTLSHVSDGILLVARPGVIDANSAKSAQELLEQSGQKVLGLVVNAISNKHEPSSYFTHAKEYFATEGVTKKAQVQTRLAS